MSLKKNTIANYIGSFYLTIVGILVVPYYIKYLGAEAYGLVGFFAMLQIWLQMLDLGLSPTLSREVARQRAGAISADSLRTLVRSLEYFFLITALFVAALLFFSSDWLTTSWLKNEFLPDRVLCQCILLMSFTIPVRWISSLYRSGLTGMEKHIWLNSLNVVSATLRAVGAVLVLEFISNTPFAFFSYQAILVVLEASILIHYFYENLPRTIIKPEFSFMALKKVFPFAGSVAFTSTVWLLVSQADKLILSNKLSLTEYGYFSLAITVASAIGIFSGPISKVLLPRMTYLISEKKEAAMLHLYRNATQFVVIFTTAVTGIVAIYAEPLVYAWVGKIDAAKSAGPILFWYVLGNGILSILAFQYYLQFAYGKLKYHLIFNVVFALIWVPLVFIMVSKYGALGAGKMWFLCQLLVFVFWAGFIHHKFARGLHFFWIKEDVLPIVLTITTFLYVTSFWMPELEVLPRWNIFAILSLLGGVSLFLGSMSSSACREEVNSYFNKRRYQNQ